MSMDTFAVIPKRWVVERCFAWLEKCRRLWENCEKNSIPVCNLLFLLFLLFYRKDFEQPLRVEPQKFITFTFIVNILR